MYLSRLGRSLLIRIAVFFCSMGWLGLSNYAQSTHPQATTAGSPTATSVPEEVSALSAAAAIIDESATVDAASAPRGFTGSFATSTQHDSSNGWSSLLTPFLGYRFDRYFGLDVGTVLYTRIDVDANVGTKAKPVYAYEPKSGAFGDTTISAHGYVSFLTLDYTGSVSMGLPTGNTLYGLGAGQVTYNINNHFEKNIGRFTPEIELGFGDTSSLANPSVLKSYIAVGPMANFQAGSSVDLPFRSTFEADAYEQLPLDNDLIYSTTGSGKKKVTTATNTDPAEDNGFITSLDIPLNPHVTMSGFYSRSLRDHDDVGGFSFTFLLKAPPRPPEVAF